MGEHFKNRKWLTTLLILILGLPFILRDKALAEVKVSDTVPVNFPQELDSAQSNNITSEDISKIIPVDMMPTDRPTNVAIRIADRSVQLWADTIGKNSVLVQSARTIEKKMQTGIDIESGGGSDLTQHKILFNFRAFETVAQIDYSGWTNAQMNYNLRDQKSTVRLTEKVLKDKELTISQERNPAESLASLGIGWKW